MPSDTDGPFILWVNNGCEGWSPKSYPTLTEALSDVRYVSDFVLTEKVSFEVVKK